jgi:hypothetical protein
MANRNKVVVKSDGTSEVIELTDDEETALDAQEKAWTDAKPSRAFDALRNKRDKLLSETDWWGASDQTMSDAQKKYRSDLRDLPAQYDNSSILGDITWPSKP